MFVLSCKSSNYHSNIIASADDSCNSVTILSYLNITAFHSQNFQITKSNLYFILVATKSKPHS